MQILSIALGFRIRWSVSRPVRLLCCERRDNGTTTLYRKLLLYRASVLGQSPESKTVIAIPVERMRVLIHEADRAAKLLFHYQEETAPLLAQSLSKQVESFCQEVPQLNTWSGNTQRK